MAKPDQIPRGFYTVTVGSIEFTVPQQYTNLQLIKSDANESVVSAEDFSTGRKVAIRKKSSPMRNKTCALGVFRELSLLSLIQHPNTVNTFSVFTPQESKDDFQDIYLVTEIMKHNLKEVISQVKLDNRHLSYFFYQILCGVNHLHREGFIHANLTPRLLSVNGNSQVKVMDFGLTRVMNDQLMDNSGRSYFDTRHYTAPELLLTHGNLEKIEFTIDVWSLGCIFAELITGTILFPGRNKPDQWNNIANLLGTPSERFISQLDTEIASFVRLKRREAKLIEEIIPDSVFCSEGPSGKWGAVDARRLISKMLIIDPNERYSIEQLLEEPFVKCWWREQEVNAPLSIHGFDRKLDEMEVSLEELKSLIFDKVTGFVNNLIGDVVY